MEQIIELIIFGLKCLIFCIMFFSIGSLFFISDDELEKIKRKKEFKKLIKIGLVAPGSKATKITEINKRNESK